MNIKVERELCQGAGICETICPEIFELTLAGTALVKVQAIPEKLEDVCRKAAKSCPTQAISVEE